MLIDFLVGLQLIFDTLHCVATLTFMLPSIHFCRLNFLIILNENDSIIIYLISLIGLHYSSIENF